MSSVSWTDSIGAATLSNGKPNPGGRVANWTPNASLKAEREWDLGVRKPHTFEFAEENTVSFDLPAIPLTNMDLMLRLKLHLLRDGLVTLNVMDLVGQSYVGCWLAPDSSVEIALTDKTCMEYTLSTRLMSGDTFTDTSDSTTTSDEPVVIPDELWDWDADAEVLIGGTDGEELDTVTDQTGNGHDATPIDSRKPVLRTNQVNGHAVFDMTGGVGVITDDAFITPPDGVTVFQVLKRTGSHVEHGVWSAFTNDAAGGSIGFQIKESNHVEPGSLDDRIQLGGFYIDTVDTTWEVVAYRIARTLTGVTVELFDRTGVKEVFNGTTGASVGFIVGFVPGTMESLHYAKMGNGLIMGGNGLNGKIAKEQGYGRALEDDEVETRIGQLIARFGI